MKSHVWGVNERYYIDSDGNIEESDGESPPQTGKIPKFVATELLRLVSIKEIVDEEKSLADSGED